MDEQRPWIFQQEMQKTECKSRFFRLQILCRVQYSRWHSEGRPCDNYQNVVKDLYFMPRGLNLRKEMDLQEVLIGIYKSIVSLWDSEEYQHFKSRQRKRSLGTKLHSSLRINVVIIYLHLRKGIKSPEKFHLREKVLLNMINHHFSL